MKSPFFPTERLLSLATLLLAPGKLIGFHPTTCLIVENRISVRYLTILVNPVITENTTETPFPEVRAVIRTKLNFLHIVLYCFPFSRILIQNAPNNIEILHFGNWIHANLSPLHGTLAHTVGGWWTKGERRRRGEKREKRKRK